MSQKTKTQSAARDAGQTVLVTGNTYPVREKLKALGARWDAERKGWRVPASQAEAAHAIVRGQPPLNNPIAVPHDHADIDLAAAAAKYGRVLLDGATAVPFRREGKASELGRTFWGKNRGKRDRYLIVHESRPFYLSRTALEDNDDFSTDPGHYRSVQAVAVQPSDEELAADEAKAKAKADAQHKETRRRAIVDAVQSTPQGRNAMERPFPTWAGMTECWGSHRMAGHEALHSDGQRLVYETSDCDMGPAAWALNDETLATEALTLK